MRVIRTAFWSSTGLLRAGAVGALLLFLFVLALNVSPQLHLAFHHDSDEGQHHCAVTLLHSGQVDVPALAETAIAPQILLSDRHSYSARNAPGAWLDSLLYERQ